MPPLAALPIALSGLALIALGAALDRAILRPAILVDDSAPAPFSECESVPQNEASRREILKRAYAAPRYWPFPPFSVVLETSPGRCDLAVASPKASAHQRRKTCAAFTAGEMMMPEPFVVRAIGSVLSGCDSRSRPRPCRVVDLGGNLGLHAAYAASLGATVDVVEPSADLAATIVETARANCWQSRMRVHSNAVTAHEAEDGRHVVFKGGWRLDDRGKQRARASNVTLLAVHRLLRGRPIDLLKIDIDNAAIETQIVVELERLLAARQTRVRAVVMEVATKPARVGAATALATALSALQSAHGFRAYRLAHHLHSLEPLEPWYAQCTAPRALKLALRVRARLTPAEWARLLKFEADAARGRSDTASLLLLDEPLERRGAGAWRSRSMDATLPGRMKRELDADEGC